MRKARKAHNEQQQPQQRKRKIGREPVHKTRCANIERYQK